MHQFLNSIGAIFSCISRAGLSSPLKQSSHGGRLSLGSDQPAPVPPPAAPATHTWAAPVRSASSADMCASSSSVNRPVSSFFSALYLRATRHCFCFLIAPAASATATATTATPTSAAAVRATSRSTLAPSEGSALRGSSGPCPQRRSFPCPHPRRL